MLAGLSRIEGDLNRDSLHHFHEVAGSIFGGQQARLHVLSCFDGSVGHHSVYGRDNGCVLQVQLRLIECGFLFLDQGQGGLSPRAHGFYLFRAGSGCAQVRLCLHHATLRSPDLLLGGRGRGTGSIGTGCSGLRCGIGLIVLLLRDLLLRDQLFVARKVVLRLHIVSFCLRKLGIRGIVLLPCRCERSFCCPDFRIGPCKLAASAGGSNGNIYACSLRCGNCIVIVSFRACDKYLVVPRIDLYERLFKCPSIWASSVD